MIKAVLSMLSIATSINRLSIYFFVTASLANVACDSSEPVSIDAAGQVSSEAPSPEDQPPATNAVQRPNVVLMLGDDIGVDLVGSYARYFPPSSHSDTSDTPILDALASEGVLFRNAWTNPACSPSRAQILTGLHARRTGIGDLVKWRRRNGQEPRRGLSENALLLPKLLKSGPVPYSSAAFGKWHLGSPAQGGLHALGPGGSWFDRWAGSQFNLNGEKVDYGFWHKTFATQIAADGSDECGPPYPCVAVLDASKSPSNYATVDTIDDAVDALESLTEPFFLYVPFNAPHTPLDLPEATLPATCMEGPLSFDQVPSSVAELTRAMTRTLDHQIGRLLCAIDPSDTVVIFIGDNGTAGSPRDGSPRAIATPFPGDHGKATLYNGGINVPLIIRGPGMTPGASEALVNSTDLFATVASMAGLTDPSLIPTDSISLAPYLYGGAHPAPRRTIHAERFSPTYTPTDLTSGSPPESYRSRFHRRAIRNKRFKLIQRHRAGQLVEEELYDLLAGGALDPQGGQARDDFEQNDLMRSRDDWEVGGEIEDNYWALRQELDVVLPPLP